MKEKPRLVLFVDDEPDILSAIRRATLRENFVPLFASSGKEALEIMEKREISVLVTDMRMPEMDGLTLLKIVRQLHPKTVRIVLSGYTQLAQVLATVNLGDIFQFIAKPWQMREELIAGVQQGLERFDLEAERDELRDSLKKKNQAYLNIFGKMEKKSSHDKKILENIEKVQHWTFSCWKKNPRLDSSEYIEFIEMIEQRYLKLLPLGPDEIGRTQMIKDIAGAFQGNVTVRALREDEWCFTGYHGFLMMACNVFAGLLELEQGKETFVTLETDEAGVEVSEIAVGMEPGLLTLSTLAQNKLIIGFSLLHEMGGLFDTRFEATKVNEKIHSLRIICRSEQAESRTK